MEGETQTGKSLSLQKHCMEISLHMFSEKTRNNNMHNHEAQIKLTPTATRNLSFMLYLSSLIKLEY